MRTAGRYPGALAIAFEMSTGNVVGNSWGAPVADQSSHTTTVLNNVVNLYNVMNFTQDATVAWAIGAMGGSNALLGPSVGMMDLVASGYVVSVRSMPVTSLPGWGLRLLLVAPSTTSHMASDVAVNVGAMFDRATTAATAWVTSSCFNGIPMNTDTWLQMMMPVIVQNKGIVNEIYAADWSLPGSAFVDVAYIANQYKWLVMNSTLTVRNDFFVPNPAMPLNLVFNTTQPSYNATLRNWFTALSPMPGVLQVLPVSATATSKIARVVVGMGYMVGANVGAAGASVTTYDISAQLRSITMAAAGSAALVFELSTGSVVGVSWLGENLIDASAHNSSQSNPIVYVANIANISSNWAMRS
ncbi:MAG: hypothetical protein AAB263_00605, partial [Planctomycetota bacterium]